jgi:hypothetical protein
MIKVETLGMLDREVLNPVLTSVSAVKNYSFLVVGGKLYLIANTLTGDDAYKDDYTIPAGEYLNGHLVEAWKGQKLVIDAKHIKFGVGQTYASNLTAGTTLLKVNDSNELVIADSAPASGVYFKVTDKCTLTGEAIKAEVLVVDEDTQPSGTTG